MTRNEFRNEFRSFREFGARTKGEARGKVLFYKTETGKVIIGWLGSYVSWTAAWAADGLIGNTRCSRDFRLHMLNKARDCGPVPLPH